ncbi:MAG: DUF4340 domain-containing protein [Spirochaetes bacterium]|nr:MAG: DUF4340 domain-containing protein [Spirochaetota bacterium]
MKNKKLYISLGIILICALVLAVNSFRSPSVPSLKAWKDAADEIVITRDGKDTGIALKEGKWQIGEKAFPADPETMTQIENKLKNLKLAELITDKPPYERYELEGERAVRVRVKAGGALLRDVTLGKKSSTMRHTYVRLGEAPEVYLATGGFDEITKPVEELRDKTVMKVSKGAIESVEIVNKGIRTRLVKQIEEKKEESPEKDEAVPEGPVREKTKKVEKWTLDGNPAARVDEGKLGQALASFDPLKAMSYSDQEVKGLAPLCTVTIRAFDKNMRLDIFKKLDESKYLCSSSESPYPFTMDSWKVENTIIKVADEIVKK